MAVVDLTQASEGRDTTLRNTQILLFTLDGRFHLHNLLFRRFENLSAEALGSESPQYQKTVSLKIIQLLLCEFHLSPLEILYKREALNSPLLGASPP
ncbi:hypothetical protein D1872_288100 [compost metagenome]